MFIRINFEYIYCIIFITSQFIRELLEIVLFTSLFRFVYNRNRNLVKIIDFVSAKD